MSSASAEPRGSFPLGTFLGLDVGARGTGRAGAELVVDPRHHNPHGVVHGGVLFTMVDTAMGAAAMTVVPTGHLCASIEVHLRFLRPVVTGVLHAEVEVVRAGRRIIHLSGQVRDDVGEVVATATGTFAVLPPSEEPAPG